MSDETNLEHELDPAGDEFKKAIQNDDPLGAIIRTHIHIEAYITNLLEELLYKPEYLDAVSRGSMGKANLACGLGLNEKLLPPLKALNNLRNDFAHKIDTNLTAQRVMNLFSAFDGEVRQTIEAVYQSTRLTAKDAGVTKPQKRWQTLPPEDRFVLFALTIRGALLAGIRQARDQQEAIKAALNAQQKEPK